MVSFIFIKFLGTALVFLSWYFSSYTIVNFGIAQGYLSLFFALFLAIPFIYFTKNPRNSWDWALIIANPFFTF